MLFAADITPFDWNRILFSDDAPPLFLLEVALRCVATYLLMLGALRVTGRRGVRQLSIFELSIILGLGSAAGDAMLYHDTPLLYAAVVFAVVTALYLLFNWLTEKFPGFSDWLEGKPVLLVADGQIQLKNFRSQNLTQKELFGELRQLQVEHLGQVRRAYIEATGNMSIYFFEEQEPVRPGLPIWPERVAETHRRAEEAGRHACACCGHVQELPRGGTAKCPVCQEEEWVPACEAKRVA
ncbi:Uncharacterized membrane protein YcaP, DUF421 family [Hymenobacter gelipurpurascens]|uniref:Uncharacterized membrane protein YcaP, DUF421 family n=1 Tax=Hymenobacter gelipurpurascens TaxID=89968 RepID=A0A212U9D3_9BACT|nr:DUF421 domain-containing protein [Hymenobacter gelipurpurascens]SNC74664.1 Uncharacterized membrane protein YcaP, DUF421 family [Hymenobacter gelipurpurascens]